MSLELFQEIGSHEVFDYFPLKIPLKSLRVTFVPEGDPLPAFVRPVKGFTGDYKGWTGAGKRPPVAPEGAVSGPPGALLKYPD
jgi:hypothetical protein